MYQSVELEFAPLHKLMSYVVDRLMERDVAKIFTQPVNIQEVRLLLIYTKLNIIYYATPGA